MTGDGFKSMLDQINSQPIPGMVWDEDDLEPVSPEEAAAGLRASIAEARENGWIPAEDPGCQCFTCRAFRDATT